MREIRGDAKTIRQLLGGAKYAIDYYQREFKWETRHVSELLSDLVEKFNEDFDPQHERSAVDKYGHYFLGSIIISDKDDGKFIVDGQQRLTTLTLLLIYLHNEQRKYEDKNKVQVAELILSTKFAKRSFNLDIDERRRCMEALFEGEKIEENGQPESIQNIAHRYRDIEELFPDELKGHALPYFIDWLIEHVHLVEITAYSDDDAYTIFETMNDRGLSLSPTDMLKGYLLANIEDSDQRIDASRLWRGRIGKLLEVGKDEPADAIKSWLRSQHAKNIRERKRGAKPGDFDRIGTEFHRWVRDSRQALQLKSSRDFRDFIERDFDFYSRQYLRLRQAADQLTPSLESVYFNANSNFTLQYPVLLSPLQTGDSESQIERKYRVAATYINIVIARRVWTRRAYDYSTMQYAMFLIMKEIRGKGPDEMAALLTKRLEDDEYDFASNDRFALHGTNGGPIERILARMIFFIDRESGGTPHFEEYITRAGKKGFEIEHIWADHYQRHKDEFNHPHDFAEYRNRIGGLLLLPKKFNASYGDLTYKRKRKHYLKQNVLAQTLHEDFYERNPGFRQFLESSDLPFESHTEFKKADLDKRQLLYLKLAEQIWDPARLSQEAES